MHKVVREVGGSRLKHIVIFGKQYQGTTTVKHEDMETTHATIGVT